MNILKKGKKYIFFGVMVVAMLLSFVLVYANEYEEDYSNDVSINLNGGTSTDMHWVVTADRDYPAAGIKSKIFRKFFNIFLFATLVSDTRIFTYA